MNRPTYRPIALLALLATALLALAAAPAAAQEATKFKLGIASPTIVDGVEEQARANGSENELRQLVGAFDGQLLDAFNQTRKFTVVGRSDLDMILKEQDFAASGMVDASDEQAAQMFKVAGCKYMVRVTVDSFQNIKESLRLEGQGEILTKRTIQCGAVVKIYDTTTAELLDSYNDLVELVAIDEGQLGVRSTGGSKLNAGIREAAQEFATRAAGRVAGVIFPAKVAAVQGGILFINQGEGSGIEVGQVWTAYLVQGGIVDPDTGETLGQIELPLADVKITRVLPKLSQAQSVDGSDPGFEVGMIVRPADNAAAMAP